jgi:hypothetical protein
MSQQFYSIPLLNELHNHFPELLYMPERFNNIQDVLRYIRSVAEISPYQRGMHQFNSQRLPYITSVPRRSTSATSTTGYGINIPSTTSTVPVGGEAQQTFVTMITEDIPNTRIRMNTNNTNTLLNTLLGGLLGDIMNPNTGLQSFLDQRVPVFPTTQEIENATTTYISDRYEEHICTICQDEIEPNQNVRRLNHCNHHFHKNCIDTWFRGNVQCPTCRHDIRENNPVNNQNQNNTPPPVPENYRRMNIRNPDT